MQPLDDRPQIGSFAADAGTLDREGTALGALAAELGVELGKNLPPTAPRGRWRVIASHQGAATTIAAPDDADGLWWRIGQIVRGRGAPTVARVAVHPTSFPRRPSKRERAGELRLHWPEVTRSAPDVDALAIDIVNRGDERWHPQGDSFVVFAALRELGGPSPSVSFGFVAGMNPAFPLDPGEYARVRVSVDSGQWDGLRPGRIEVHPVLIDLGVHIDETLEIELTESDVQRHRPRRPD